MNSKRNSKNLQENTLNNPEKYFLKRIKIKKGKINKKKTQIIKKLKMC